MLLSTVEIVENPQEIKERETRCERQELLIIFSTFIKIHGSALKYSKGTLKS